MTDVFSGRGQVVFMWPYIALLCFVWCSTPDRQLHENNTNTKGLIFFNLPTQSSKEFCLSFSESFLSEFWPFFGSFFQNVDLILRIVFNHFVICVNGGRMQLTCRFTLNHWGLNQKCVWKGLVNGLNVTVVVEGSCVEITTNNFITLYLIINIYVFVYCIILI